MVDRYIAEGSKVKYLAANGYNFDREKIEKLGITKGAILTVKSKIVEGWRTELQFEEIEGWHNSVMFSEE